MEDQHAYEKDISIILLTSSYPSSLDVINRNFMTDFAESLTKKRIHVYIICPHQPNLPYREELKKITIIRFPYWFTTYGEKFGGGGGMIPSMRRSLLSVVQLIPFCICQFIVTMNTIKKEDINLIHSHWIIPQGLIGAVIRLITGIPHIVSIHGTDIHLIHSHRVAYPLIKIISLYSNYITTNSSYTYRLLMDIIHQRKSNTCIIPMGIFPDEYYSNLNIDKKEKTILFIGRLIAWKGVNHLIAAMNEVILRVHNVQLKIIGNGPARAELKQLTRMMKISSHVQFLDNIDRGQLLLHYKKADLFVLPSITVDGQTEGLGVVLLEGMASGVPVIGSNTGGIPDIIDDGVNGLLVPPGDPEALASAIMKILNNHELAEKFAQEGLRTVKERFSWDKISDQFIEIYQEVLHESNEL